MEKGFFLKQFNKQIKGRVIVFIPVIIMMGVIFIMVDQKILGISFIILGMIGAVLAIKTIKNESNVKSKTHNLFFAIIGFFLLAVSFMPIFFGKNMKYDLVGIIIGIIAIIYGLYPYFKK